MRRASLFIVACIACGAASEAFSQTPVSQQIRVPRPSLRVHYDVGWGSSISVRGSQAPLNWTTGQSAQWHPGNIWIWDGPTGMGDFEFKPLINDMDWSTGANYFVPGGVGVVHVYPFFGASQGSLQIVPNFYSPQLGNTRSLRIYLPPGYFENPAKHYPVLYMHDGQNLFDANTAAFGVEWEVDETFDHEIGNGRVEEAIVVGIDNTFDRIFEYSPTADPLFGGGGGDLYLDFVEDTVKTYIDTIYRTIPDKHHTLMMGSSLGGLISFYAGWSRPHTFGRVGCMSSSFWWDGESLTVAVETHNGPRPAAVFYLDSGGISDGAAQTFRMRDALDGIGYEFGEDLFHWYEPFGSHNEASWAARLHIPLRNLLPWQ